MSIATVAIKFADQKFMHLAAGPIYSAQLPKSADVVAPEHPLPPGWVKSLCGLDIPSLALIEHGMKAGIRAGEDFSLVSVQVVNAVKLSSVDLRRQTRAAYASIFSLLHSGRKFSPQRFWNFLPSIHEPMEDAPGGTARIENARIENGRIENGRIENGLSSSGSSLPLPNRYMVFNSGRFAAYEKQFGPADQFDRKVPTASAVGHAGDDLWIHCLASSFSSMHQGNPRQISPHRYSSRFGKRPPCFARATLLQEKSWLLIGGTASICGEESLHDDLPAQTEETLENLSSLLLSNQAELDCITHLRVYHPNQADARWLETRLQTALPNLTDLELIQAELCRPELLVEIEGMAILPRSKANGVRS